MLDLQDLLRYMDEGGFTLAVQTAEGEMITSKERGISPLLALLPQKEKFCGALAADKVTGKAAAFLYVLLGVKGVRTHLSSLPAQRVYAAHGIEHVTDADCERIVNRRGDGLCPMESAVMEIDEPEQAAKVLFALCKK